MAGCQPVQVGIYMKETDILGLILYLVTCDEPDWSKSVCYMATYTHTFHSACVV